MSYQDVKDKLYHGHKKVANNTYLQLEEYYLGDNAEVPAECISMRLHGNVVVSFHKECLFLYSAGWRTVTTKDRLNLALSLAGMNGYSIWQHNYTWYYGYLLPGKVLCLSSTEFYDGMKIDYTGKVIS